MGTTLRELKANISKDPTLAPIVQSTCSMVRDFAVKAISLKNQKANTSLNDICYGQGQVMFQGQMVATGGCLLKRSNANDSAPPEPPAFVQLYVGDGSNAIFDTCELKKGDI